MSPSIDIHEAIKAIQDVLPLMDPEDDYRSILATKQTVIESDAKRRKELKESHEQLKALSKALEAARISSKRPSAVPSAEAHAALVNELDRSRLSLMKAISDTEGMVATKEAELARLKEEARRLEESDPALDHEKELDSTALRLQLYKGLGFEPLADKNGVITKMLVRSRSGDIHTVDLNDGRSEQEIREHLWQLASS
ncbi:hypothetical protein AMATHDRAFT_74200 [Amanita thiersii Skay4041]|uniref:Kinetochore protein Spc24 n=1 Tax=Amanita thiersii Skay4041 TaxID=703135 RepID=A0A2A9NX21_9AGAR|nr:hypothetical protein AMATHDRAFT_74200 [Amanita thiersii Skay4041]